VPESNLNPAHASPQGDGFRLKAEVLSGDDVRRAITRIAHEVLERNRGLTDVVLIGVQRGGVWIAEQLATAIAVIDGSDPVPVGTVDASMFRDDIGIRPISPGSVTDIPIALDGKIVVLVDDVLYTGRTVRAAIDAIHEYGRPRMVQLAVLVDRGHRELPIRPDYVGKNLPSSNNEDVRATHAGVTIHTAAPTSVTAAAGQGA
jgi:pyrimidine operon attenuation protein/uracil phosphoribosyltransferase